MSQSWDTAKPAILAHVFGTRQPRNDFWRGVGRTPPDAGQTAVPCNATMAP
jgi:hypothetical protein